MNPNEEITQKDIASESKQTAIDREKRLEVALEREKLKKSLKEWKMERTSFSFSVFGLAMYLLLQATLLPIPGRELAYHSLSLVALIGVLQHYLLILIKILKDPWKRKNKWIEFLLVLITGQFGSWIYTLAVSRRMYQERKVSIP